MVGVVVLVGKRDGFTLLELAVVVVIIAVIAAVALPAYQGYTGRATVGAALAEMSMFRGKVVDELSTKGVCPVESNDNWDVSRVLSGYSMRVSTDTPPDCVVVVKFKDVGISSKVVNKVLLVTAHVSDGGVFSWSCVSDIDADALPSACTHVDVAPAFP